MLLLGRKSAGLPGETDWCTPYGTQVLHMASVGEPINRPRYTEQRDRSQIVLAAPRAKPGAAPHQAAPGAPREGRPGHGNYLSAHRTTVLVRLVIAILPPAPQRWVNCLRRHWVGRPDLIRATVVSGRCALTPKPPSPTAHTIRARAGTHPCDAGARESRGPREDRSLARWEPRSSAGPGRTPSPVTAE